jgi:LPXTG-motif cell wall-anchored protein
MFGLSQKTLLIGGAVILGAFLLFGRNKRRR